MCVIFGQLQKLDYPNHCFCNNCDKWDNFPCKNRKLHQGMKKYQFIANYQSFIILQFSRKYGNYQET